MSITVDVINLRFNIKPDYDQQQLQQLQEDLKNGQKEMEKTRRAMDKLSKNGLKAMTEEERKEFDKLSATLNKTAREVRANEKKMQEWTRSADINKMSLQQLGQRAKDLSAVLNNINPNTPEFREFKTELEAVKERMRELRGQTKEAQSGIISFAKTFNHIGFAITSALAIKDRIVQWADQYVQAFAKMDEAMTDVQKYTGQTKAEVERMNEAFQKMTTRTAREELNALAGAAGRLGITAEKDIIGFVDAADKINVALGDDLGQGAIDQIGKLAMLFGEDKTKGLNGAMLATGSALNELGASSSAATGFIAEFTSDMAGMAVNARIAQTDIMGYASALSQAGIEGKTASGVFAQMLTKMFTDPAKFAHAAGLDVKAFTDLLKTDANQAIMQFLEGLKAHGGFDGLAPALKSLSMQGTQAVPVISSLIGKMDELRLAQDVARKAYDEGTSIIHEFNNANSSAAAQLEIKKKALNDEAAALGQKLMPIVESSISTGTAVLKLLSALISFTIEHRTQLILLAANVAALTGIWKLHAVWLAVVDAKNKAVAFGNKALAASMVLLRSAGVALQAVWAGLTKGVAGYTAVMRAARMASLLNPWIALGTALTTLGVVVYGLTKAWQNHAQALREQDPAYRAMRAHAKDMQDINKRVNSETAKEIATLHHLTNVIHSNVFSIDERRKAISQLESIVPGYHASIDKEGKLIETNTGKLDEYISRLKAAARAQAYMDKMAEIAQEQLDNDLLLSRKQNNLKAVDAELNRGKNTTYKSDKKTRYIPGNGVEISGSVIEIEQNDRLISKLKERKHQEEAINNALKKREELNRRQQQLEQQMQKDGIATGVTITGTKPPHTPITTTTTDGSPTTPTNNKTTNTQAAKERREAEALLKQQLQEELNDLKEQYQQQRITEELYHDQQYLARQDYYARLLDVQRKYGASQSELQETQNQQMDALIAHANQQRTDALAAEERQYQAEQVAAGRERLEGRLADEQEYSDRLLQLEEEHHRRRLLILREGTTEYMQEEQRLQDTLLRRMQQQNRQKEEQQKAAQEVMQRFMATPTNSIGSMQDFNEQLMQKGLISYQQYQDNKEQIAREGAERRQQIEQAAFDATQQLLSSTSSLFSALQQRETAQVDAKYKRLIAAAKKQGRDTAELEEQQEAEKMAIQKKYAQKQFRLQVLQIIAATAQAIANIWREWAANPAMAAALSAVAAAQGALQLATAKAQADQAAGLYKGGYSDEYQEGYTRKGNPREEAGVIPVHKNEFVVNHKAVGNPHLRPVLDVIDRHQKAGDVHLLNSTRMLEEAYGQGRYRGGYTAHGADTGETMETFASGGEAEELLRRIERNTAGAITLRDLRREIRHEEMLEQNAKR